MVFNSKLKELYIIGLLMGSFECTNEWGTFYQAMPFGPALKHLEYLYRKHIMGLRMMCGPEDGISAMESLPHLSKHSVDSGLNGYSASLEAPAEC